MIIALVNQKGGVGKSTTAVHLAWWLKQQGRDVLLVDADTQQSSSAWAAELKLDHEVIGDPEDLFERLPSLAAGRTVVVDGPGSLAETTKAVLVSCDIALIPMAPSALDLHSSSKMFRIVRHALTLRSFKAIAFLNQAQRNTLILGDAQAAIAQSGIPLAKAVIHQRQCIRTCPSIGATVFDLAGDAERKAAADFSALFEEVLSHA